MRLGSFVLRRGFASSARRLDNYGFIGLGQMVCVLPVALAGSIAY
jgi:hypothetical protein